MNLKSLFLTCLLFLGLCGHVFSAPSLDSLKDAHVKIDNLTKNIGSLAKRVDFLEKNNAELVKKECTGEVKGFGEWFVVLFMPVVMLLFSIVFFFVFKKSDEFKVSKLIGIGMNKQNGEAVEGQSTSRFILLLTGLTAVFVSTTLVMYYGYMMVAQCNNVLDLDGLWKILAGLGIGIIPYGINVWNKNVKEEAATGATTNPQT